jgi:hypothetical protein
MFSTKSRLFGHVSIDGTWRNEVKENLEIDAFRFHSIFRFISSYTINRSILLESLLSSLLSTFENKLLRKPRRSRKNIDANTMP